MPSGIARREFTKLLGFGSFAFLIVKVATAARKLWLNVMPNYAASVPVASIHEVAVGGYKHLAIDLERIGESGPQRRPVAAIGFVRDDMKIGHFRKQLAGAVG